MSPHLSGRLVPVLLLSVFVSCSDDQDLDVVTKITLSSSAIVFDSVADQQVTVVCTGPWTASLSDNAWFRIDRSTGKGKDVITISLRRVGDPIARSATLTIASQSNPAVTRSIPINKTEVEFRLSHDAVELDREQPQTGVVVTHSGSWTATLSDDSWCRIDRSTGTGSAEIRVTVYAPADTVCRSAVLTVASDDYPSLSTDIPIAFAPPEHGRLKVLNRATRGRGIDLIILGDGFTVSDFTPGGKWDALLERSMETLFALEPLRSFRDCFNVYAVSAVSAVSGVGTGARSDTFFETYYINRFIRTWEQRRIWDFVCAHTPVADDPDELENVAVSLLLNDSRYGGTAYLSETNGLGISPLHPQYFEYALIHETMGHAFGKLADEYVEYTGTIPATTVERSMLMKTAYGYYQNVEYTARQRAFSNPFWRSLLDSDYSGVGIFEGGHTYPSGVWRSSKESIMNGRIGGFNAVSREILVRRIYQLAGLEDQYNLEVFKNYDRINADTRQDVLPTIALPPAWYPPI